MTTVRAVTDSNTKDQDVSKKQQLVTGPVVIYDVFCLLPVDKRLAANYVYESSLTFDSQFNTLLLSVCVCVCACLLIVSAK